MEKVAVERELGSGQSTFVTRILLIILGHLALVLMLHWLSGNGPDVVLTPGNCQVYPEM